MTGLRGRRRATIAATALAVALLGAACGRDAGNGAIAPPTTQRVGNTDAYSYTLSCPSPIGDLTTSITYTVTDSIEDVMPGQTVTYRITAPIAQVKAPITPSFISSTSTFAIPEGFMPTSASTDPPKNQDFSSSSATVRGNDLVETLNGDFSLDGTDRPTPTIVVTGTVTAAPGKSITWMTPSSVSGKAHAGLLGDQESNCSFPTSGPIGHTDVAA
jgi:hypothetical protein